MQTILSHSHSMAAGILSTNAFAYRSIPFSFYGCRDPEYERDRDVTRRGDLAQLGGVQVLLRHRRRVLPLRRTDLRHEGDQNT